MEVGVTPTSEAVLPVVPAHAAASAAGAKLKPADVGDAAAVGALAALAAAPGLAAAPVVLPPWAAVLTPEPTEEPEPAAAPPAAAAAVVVVLPAATAVRPESVPPLAPAPR